MRRGSRTSTWNSLSALGPVLRCAVILRGDSLCAWCGLSLAREDVQIDHVVPRSAGGSNKPDNLVPACARCNSERDAELVPAAVREQLRTPITASLRDAARVLADAWYPWRQARAERNRQRQAERDRRRRELVASSARTRCDAPDDELPF